tara:strand:+ start:104 stop:334 length:231 start_codon:yes stop_codon:yes gene_type:complete
MIRLHLNPSIVKSLNSNEKEESLEIEFKEDVKTSQHIDIPMSIIQDYVNSVKESAFLKSEENIQSNLKIVYSNFAS